MKVSDLIELLEGMDPDADIFIMSQPQWPFELSLSGVCRCRDFAEPDDWEDDEEVEARRGTTRSRPLVGLRVAASEQRRLPHRGQPAPLRQQKRMGRDVMRGRETDMGPQFFQTRMGQRCYEVTVPKIATELARLADNVAALNETLVRLLENRYESLPKLCGAIADPQLQGDERCARCADSA